MFANLHHLSHHAAWRRQLEMLLESADLHDLHLLADKIMLMSNGPFARIAEIVEVTMPRERNRKTMHHDPQFYRIRNHLVDFLVKRSRIEATEPHDPQHPPLVRPGVDGSGAAILTLPVSPREQDPCSLKLKASA